MFDQIQEWLLLFPYLGVAILFVLCGLGLPLPEEIVLLGAGYACAKLQQNTTLALMMAWCGGSILAGDLIPFVVGRVFGTRLLRVRWMRVFVTRRRLSMFDRWFRRRGDLVILVARFVAGLRVVAFFTAGAMKMRWTRFLVFDSLGISLVVPTMTLIGYHSQGLIDEVIENVKRVERGILWAALGAATAILLWYWVSRRRQRRLRRRGLGEAFVQPSLPVQGDAKTAAKDGAAQDAVPAVPPPVMPEQNDTGRPPAGPPA
jgi:membrane protein DedA with SNARE-associated domain